MFTKNHRSTKNGENPGRRGPGRPPGRSPKGRARREALYRTAVDLIGERGYEATTLRDIAGRAGVSPALLYRYFPGKSAVVLALYDELSATYAQRAERMPSGPWRVRAMFAMRTSLEVLAPHRATLRALTPILVGDPDRGLFATATAFSRERVQQVFVEAVAGARESLGASDAERLGRILYVVHLSVILWWLLDRSPEQRATARLLDLLTRLGGATAVAIRLPGARRVLRALDETVLDGLLRASQSTGGGP